MTITFINDIGLSTNMSTRPMYGTVNNIDVAYSVHAIH